MPSPFFRRLKAKVKAFGQYRGVAGFFSANGIFTGGGREGALSMEMAINCTFLDDGFPGGRARTADISPQPGERRVEGGTLKVLDLFPPSLRAETDVTPFRNRKEGEGFDLNFMTTAFASMGSPKREEGSGHRMKRSDPLFSRCRNKSKRERTCSTCDVNRNKLSYVYSQHY